MKNKILLAGAAKSDISPELGIQIAGDIGRKRPCTGIQEPIYARALVLEQAGQRYCIITVDVLAIDTPWSDEVRRRAQKQFGLDPKAIMVHATQNHAAPSIGNHMCRDEWPLIPAEHDWLRGGDARSLARARNFWNHQRRENADDGDDQQHFNERKCAM